LSSRSRTRQQVAAVDLAPAVGAESELVQDVLGPVVVVARDGDKSLEFEGSEGLANDCVTGLCCIAAAPVGGAEGVAELDVRPAALKRLESRLPDEVARLALEYRGRAYRASIRS
jgi:hypothetical protein